MTELNKLKKDGFYISTPEFALMLGISTEALRSRRRRGQYEGQYKFDGKNYLWAGLRPNQVKKVRNDLVKNPSRLSLNPRLESTVRGSGARVRRRGIVKEGGQTRYPNLAFKNKNDARMFARITKGKDVNFLNRFTDKTLDVVHREMQQDAQQTIDNFKPIKNYGFGIYDARNEPIPNKRIRWADEAEDEEREFWSKKPYY